MDEVDEQGKSYSPLYFLFKSLSVKKNSVRLSHCKVFNPEKFIMVKVDETFKFLSRFSQDVILL